VRWLPACEVMSPEVEEHPLLEALARLHSEGRD
jgi:hypothetical protein